MDAPSKMILAPPVNQSKLSFKRYIEIISYILGSLRIKNKEFIKLSQISI